MNLIKMLKKALERDCNANESPLEKNDNGFETKDSKTFTREAEETIEVEEQKSQIEVDVCEINMKIKKAKERRQMLSREKKPKRTSAKSMKKEKENRKEAEIKNEKEQAIISKRAVLFYKAALQVTENDYEKAKQVLAVKKVNLLVNYVDTKIDVMAINIAIDELDEVILRQHGEITFKEKTKIK